MSVLENRLTFACNQVADAATEFMEWIAANGALLGAERVSLLHELHANEAAAERLAASAKQMASVAFVGPSRSGKTSVIIPVVKGAGGPLALRFDGIHERVDYVGQIVPDGKWGLSSVIRLSGKERPAPRNFPIAVRLLSCADIVRILGRAFLTAPAARDIVPTLDDVRTAGERAASKTVQASWSALSEEEVWEIRAYFAQHFGATSVFRALSAANYWQTLAKYGPHIPNAELAQLLSLIWGATPDFTQAFADFADILESLNGSLDVNCSLNALLSINARTGKLSRRSDTVLSGGIACCLGEALADEEPVVVCNQFGLWKSIARSGLAALAAEVRLPLAGGHGEILENADVLEFPGIDAAPASSAAGNGRSSSAPSAHGRAFLRAKSVYLLERYIVDHKITGMVLCVDPGCREIGELAGLVQRWVESTHGADPSIREQQDSALFLALTKIDREIGPNARGREVRRDWGERIRSMLLTGFGHHYDWPHEWTVGRPFDRVHLIRSPSVKSKQLCDYASDGSEHGFKPEQTERIARASDAFLRNDLVRRHVAEPAAVWREAFVLNDGGSSYLAQSIAEVCNAHVKQRQLVLALNGLRQGMKERLQRYFLSDSYSFQQGRRHTRALHVVRRLRNSADKRRFGQLLDALQVNDAELCDVLRALELRPHPPVKKEGDASGPATAARADAKLRDEASAYAQAAVDYWIKAIRALASDAAACQTYQLPRQALLDLVDELIVGAVRLELDRRIVDLASKLIAEDVDRAAVVAQAALVASRSIAEYVMSLGFTDVLSNSHPRRKGSEQSPIFPPRQAVALSSAGEGTSLPDEYRADWAQAFLRLVEANVADLREREMSEEQNRKLGRLLRLLDITL